MNVLPDTEVLILTKSGGRVPIFRPDPESFTIDDIAAGLARRYRWNSQSDLTVAQHCVHVSRRLAGYEAQWGLLHDAAEAYLPDVARPFKAKLMVHVPFGRGVSAYQGFEKVEHRMLRAIGNKFGLDWPIPPAVHEADDRELAREARDLFGAAPENAYPEPLDIVPAPIAENLFKRRFVELFREYA